MCQRKYLRGQVLSVFFFKFSYYSLIESNSMAINYFVSSLVSPTKERDLITYIMCTLEVDDENNYCHDTSHFVKFLNGFRKQHTLDFTVL